MPLLACGVGGLEVVEVEVDVEVDVVEVDAVEVDVVGAMGVCAQSVCKKISSRHYYYTTKLPDQSRHQ